MGNLGQEVDRMLWIQGREAHRRGVSPVLKSLLKRWLDGGAPESEQEESSPVSFHLS